MATVIDALMVTLGLDAKGLEAGVKQSEASLSNLKNTTLKVFSILAGGLALTAVAKNYLNAADAAAKFSRQMNVDVEDLQGWERAVAESGGTVNGFRSSVENLSSNLVDLAVKGTSRVAPFFQGLGVQMLDAAGKARPAFDVLGDGDFITGFFIGLGIVIGVVFRGQIMRAVAAQYALLAPYLALIAVVALVAGALALLYDDWATWLADGESALGGFWQFFADIWKRIAPTVISVINLMTDAFKSGFDFLADVVKFFIALFTGDLDDIVGAGKAVMDSLLAVVKAGWELIATAFSTAGEVLARIGPAIADGIKAAFSAMFDWIVARCGVLNDVIQRTLKFFGMGGDANLNVKNETTSGDALVSQIPVPNVPVASAAQALRPSTIANHHKATNINQETKISTINVQTQATDAKGIAASIGSAMSDALVSQADTGIA